MKFIHIADVHLGAKPDKGYPWSEWRKEEIWDTFRRIIDRANEEDVDLLLIAGDLFHGQPLNKDLKEVNYLFGKLKRAQVVMIMGNHDHLKSDSNYLNFLSWNDNVACLYGREPQCIHFSQFQTTVYGFSYYEREIRERLYDDLHPNETQGCHILLAHGGDELHIPIDKSKMAASGFDYIAMGHIHKPQMLIRHKMAYAGALEPIDQNETGEHGYILGEYTAGEMRIRFVPFAKRRYIHLEQESKVSMTDSAMEDILKHRIEELGREHIYRIRITGVRDAEIHYDTERYKRFGNILQVEDRSEPDYDISSLYHQHRDDILGKYIAKLYADGDTMGDVRKQALYYGIRALIDES